MGFVFYCFRHFLRYLYFFCKVLQKNSHELFLRNTFSYFLYEIDAVRVTENKNEFCNDECDIFNNTFIIKYEDFILSFLFDFFFVFSFFWVLGEGSVFFGFLSFLFFFPKFTCFLFTINLKIFVCLKYCFNSFLLLISPLFSFFFSHFQIFFFFFFIFIIFFSLLSDTTIKKTQKTNIFYNDTYKYSFFFLIKFFFSNKLKNF